MKTRLFVIDWKFIAILCLPVIFCIAVKLSVNYSPHSLCLFKNFTGHECWGCGMTRAFNALLNLDFKRAYAFNPRVVIVAPLMVYIWLETLIKYVKHKKNNTISEIADR